MPRSSADVVGQWFSLASAEARVTAISILFPHPTGRKILVALLNRRDHTIADGGDATAEVQAILDQLAAKPERFDEIAPALLTQQGAGYPWPSWFRIRCEADCCQHWSKSPYRGDIGAWAELSLGQLPEAARHELYRTAKTPAQRAQYHARWLKWYRESPEAAGTWTEEIFWEELIGTPPTQEPLFLLAGADKSSFGSFTWADASRRHPPLWFTAGLAAAGVPDQPQSLDRYLPVLPLLDVLHTAQQQLSTWQTRLIAALIRHGLAGADAIPSELLRAVYRALIDDVDREWAAFTQALDDSLRQLSALAATHARFSLLLSEMTAMRRAESLHSPTETLGSETTDEESLSVDIRRLAIIQAELTERENRVIASIFSPLEKMFDLKLTDAMPRVQTCLQPLDLAWITEQPTDAEFNPVYHQWVGTSAHAHAPIALKAPGLLRKGQVVTKAWGEPGHLSQVKEDVP
jgi:hypothetical protein